MTDEPALFAIVPLPPPGPAREALLAGAIAFGGSDELLRKFFACEATESALAEQQAQTAEVASRVADIGMHLMNQVEALTVRADKQRQRDAKRKADQARQAAEAEARAREAEVAAYLDASADPDRQSSEPQPSLNDATPEPTPFDADLSELGPPEHERYRAGDAEGDLPPELTAKVPPAMGTFSEPNPEELGGPPDPHQIAQPISISLNEARP
jgi:hypothetical protein